MARWQQRRPIQYSRRAASETLETFYSDLLCLPPCANFGPTACRAAPLSMLLVVGAIGPRWYHSTQSAVLQTWRIEHSEHEDFNESAKLRARMSRVSPCEHVYNHFEDLKIKTSIFYISSWIDLKIWKCSADIQLSGLGFTFLKDKWPSFTNQIDDSFLWLSGNNLQRCLFRRLCSSVLV